MPFLNLCYLLEFRSHAGLLADVVHGWIVDDPLSGPGTTIILIADIKEGRVE